MSTTLIIGLVLLAGGLLLGKVFVANFELETPASPQGIGVSPSSSARC
jgi:hypothetical protein